MNLYAESSAILSWLLHEPEAEAVAAALESAGIIASSELTLLEIDRALIRAVATGALDEGAAASRRALLLEESRYWYVLRTDDAIVDRARRPFPGEPIRTLDALHLASALVAAANVADLALLSVDRRVRQVAEELGFALVPA